MGSTLEAQQAKAPKPKSKSKSKKKVVGTASPGKPYYSSNSLRRGYDVTLPSAVAAEQKRGGPMGMLSPGAVLLKGGIRAGRLFDTDDEGDVGSRQAEKVAKEMVKRNDGGIARKTRIF
tara:strand:- start:5 stop:361 length:357 start_codon:yes stop_codon:yes gene_type:complete